MTEEIQPSASPESAVSQWRQSAIAALALVAICVHLVIRYGFGRHGTAANAPLLVALILGGLPLVYELLVNVIRRQFGSDLLAGISIVTSVILGEYLAGDAASEA